MAPIATCRCPSCGVLNSIEQSICARCLGPLLPNPSSAPAEPMTGETCSLYRASASNSLLLLSRTTLEYTAAEVAFTTPWSNVASITHGADDDLLWLYQTPQQIKLSLGSSHAWFSEITRTIPLRQFGYPANHQLSSDLFRYAPQLRHFIHPTANVRG
jgi:hypothetical protein